MKDLFSKIIANLHVFIVLYGLWTTYEIYETHTAELEQVQSQIAGVDSEIATNQQKVKEIQDFMKKLNEYKIRIEEVAKNIETVQKQLPADIIDSQIMTFFNQEMSILNIKDANLVPGNEVTASYYISKDYNLKVKGTFLQFLIFFERIGNASRIYNVKGIKLTSADDKKKGRFQMISAEGVIQAFRYNPNFKVDRGIQPENAAVPAVTQE